MAVSLLVACAATSRAQAPADPVLPQTALEDHATAARRIPLPQLVPRTHEERELRYKTQHRIILNVSVADRAGHAATGLGQSDFTLLDGPTPRSLATFRSATGGLAPSLVNVVLVLDAANNSSRRLGFYRRELERYLRRGTDHLPFPTSLAVFSGGSIEAGHPSQDRAALLAELASRAPAHPTGCLPYQSEAESIQAASFATASAISAKSTLTLECINQRFVSSVAALHRFALQQKEIPGRVLLLWLGPGWPRLTDREFMPDTDAIKQNRYQQIVDVSTALREAQITLDAVLSPDDSPRVGARETRNYAFFEGVADPANAAAGHLGLHALAEQTGGQIFPVERDLAEQINACLFDAGSYYVLAFDAPPAAAFGEFHPIEVRVARPGVTVRTTHFYYAEQ